MNESAFKTGMEESVADIAKKLVRERPRMPQIDPTATVHGAPIGVTAPAAARPALDPAVTASSMRLHVRARIAEAFVTQCFAARGKIEFTADDMDRWEEAERQVLGVAGK